MSLSATDLYIMMTRLVDIRLDRFAAAAGTVNGIFEKACRFMGGHSQPQEQLNIRPTLAALEEDWSTLRKARADYIES
jgi:hypothetical protein